ncbi:MAG: tRNA pseudouridine(38-40) synthase TruA [Halobacteriovoraceae bacterium]|nr:tRNA pseudouridine(38-40) synthase TruA [Halobacteriovoraceae bacterium]
MSTYNYLLKISYHGQDFEGWQIQPDGHRTIQGCLNKALKKISKSEEVSSLGSGRTDSGVHALAQIVKVKIPLEINPENLKNALNSHLPKSIRILEADKSDSEFHPVAGAKWKRYDYLIAVADVLPPHYEGLLTHVPKAINIHKLREALSHLKGTKDFERFSTKGTPVKSTIRTLFQASVEEEEWEVNPYSKEKLKVLRLSFIGDGFLKQMVRLLVGASLNVGQENTSLEDIKKYLTD